MLAMRWFTKEENMSKEESSGMKPGRTIKPILTTEEEHRFGFYDRLFWNDGDFREKQEKSKREALGMLNAGLERLRKREGVRPGEEKE